MLKKLSLLFLVVSVLITMFTGCDNSVNSNEEQELTHSGQYLTDIIETISIGENVFSFDTSYEDMVQLFGDDMLTYVPYENHPELEHQTTNGKFMAHCPTFQTGNYWGTISFMFDEGYKNGSICSVYQEFPYEEGIHSANVSWIENGEVMSKEVVLDPSRVVMSINELTSGVATREDFRKVFGNGREEKAYYSVREVYIFEDYSMQLCYDEKDVFQGAIIVLRF